MKPLFADTFYWVALTVLGDAAHAQARLIKADIVTIDEVLIEYLTFFPPRRNICGGKQQ